MDRKIILDLAGGTGAWSRPYANLPDEYDVRVITLPEHDVRDYIPSDFVYGILAAPPCTMFSYARSRAKTPRDLRQGMEIVNACERVIRECFFKAWDNKNIHGVKFWALENPYRGYLLRFKGEPQFVFSPHEFGDRWSKQTGLWGWFNKPVKDPIELSDDELRVKKVNSSKRLSQIPMEIRKGLTQSDLRAITPPGFANAFFKANR